MRRLLIALLALGSISTAWADVTGNVAPPGGSGSAAPTCVLGQLVYYAANGTTISCLALGTNLTISGGTLNASSTAATAFSALTGSTNTTAAMLVGTGASLNYSGSGTINASSLGGATFASPGAIGGTTPAAGAFTTLSASGQLTSTIATGTAPFSVASTTPVANLSIGGTAANITATSNSTLTTLSALTSVNGSSVPASAGTMWGSTGSFTVGHCIEVGSTSPQELQDAGSACGSGSAGVSSVAAGTGVSVAGTGTGPYTGAVTVSLPTSGATAGSYTSANITVNAQGIVTAAANGTASASSVTPGTTTVNGATAPCVLDNSTGTTMGCAALGGGLTLSSGTLSTTQGLRTVSSGTTDTILSTDAGNLVNYDDASNVAVTVPQATGSFGTGFAFTVENTGTGSVVLTPTTSTIGGLASLNIPNNMGCSFVSDGTNWQPGSCTALTHLVIALSAGSTVTPNCGGAINTVTITANATINTPTGCTPYTGQKLVLIVQSASPYTYTATGYLTGATTGAWPASSTGSSKDDHFVLIYDGYLGTPGWTLDGYNLGL